MMFFKYQPGNSKLPLQILLQKLKSCFDIGIMLQFDLTLCFDAIKPINSKEYCHSSFTGIQSEDRSRHSSS